MLEHEQKNVWKMIGMRIRRERIKRNWRANGISTVFTLCTFGLSHTFSHKFIPGLDPHQAQKRTAQCGDCPEQDN